MNKVKKIFLGVFAICAIMAMLFMPTTAYAEGTITTVQIGDLDYPVVGKALDTTYSVPDSGVAYLKDVANQNVTWYDQGTSGFSTNVKGDVLSAGAVAQSGHYYMAEIQLCDEKYADNLKERSLFSENLSITFKDSALNYRCETKEVDFFTNNEYQVKIQLYFQPDTVFDDANVISLSSEITDIYGGDTPFDKSAIDISGYERYFEVNVEWLKGNTTMNASDKFVVGETYTLRLSLNSEKIGKHAYFAEPWLDDMAYVFLDNLPGTTYQNNPMGYIVDFKYVAKGNISSVDIEGIINPTEYTAMQTTGFNIIAEGVEFDSVEWNKTSGVEFPVPVTGKFQPDTDYRLVIHLRAKDGYAFNLTKNSVDCNVGTVNEVHQNSNEASIEIDFEIGAHTHNYNGDWKTDSTNHWKVCVCEEKAQTAVHTYDKGVVTKKETVTEKGVMTYTCTVCGYKKTEDIPVHVHTYDTGVVTKKAVYKKTGIKTFTCTVCGQKKTEVIPVLKYELAKKGATIKDGKGNSYKVTKSHKTKGTVTFVKPKNKNVTTVTIPATVKVKGVTYKVTAIEKNAFVGCKKLTKVTIGKNVATIGTKAFYNCKKLKTITIKTTKLTAKKIGKNAFKGTNSKATVNIPKSKYNVYKKALKAKGVSAKAKLKKN